jgi:hypothetical protein
LVPVALLVVSNVWWELWQIGGGQGRYSMAQTLPPCNGQTLVEGFTYQFRDPHRGEIVNFRGRGAIGGSITPDLDSREVEISKRVIAFPATLSSVGTTASTSTAARRTTSRRLRSRACTSAPRRISSSATIGSHRRTVATSGRYLATRSMRGRILVVWPLRRFGVPRYDKSQVPPGPLCSGD